LFDVLETGIEMECTVTGSGMDIVELVGEAGVVDTPG
jgi:hypothetical protein